MLDPKVLRELADAIDAHEMKMREMFVRGRHGQRLSPVDYAELQALQRERERATRAFRKSL